MLDNFYQPQSLVIVLLALLLTARVLGEIAERFKIPAIIGEVMAGIILGPAILNWIAPNESISVLSDLGVFFLVVLAGLEIIPHDISTSLKGRNIFYIVFASLIPFISGALIGYLFKMPLSTCLFIGLCFTVTALPISARILLEMNKLNTPTGQRIISIAVIADVLSLLLLGVVIEVNNLQNINQFSQAVVFSLLKLVLLLFIFVLLYRIYQYAKLHFDVIRQKVDLLMLLLKGNESIFALVIVFILLFAGLTQFIGLHFIVGAFFASMLLNRQILGTRNYIRVRRNLYTVTMGLLAPVFFASIGLSFKVFDMSYFLFFIVLVAGVITSKTLSGLLGARLAGHFQIEGLTTGLGISMSGLMGLVIANVAYTQHFINNDMYSVLVSVGLFTTLVIPILLKKTFVILDKKYVLCLDSASN
ncbi:MAG TPA: cation:proton antiporter [Bacteroidales bacterium]